MMGDPTRHNKDLFRWKRQTEPLVHHSDTRKVKVDGDDHNHQVEHWLKTVEAATDVAAKRTFSTDEASEESTPMSNLHRHFNNNVRFHEHKSEVAYAEAQELLNDWMTKNFINELIGDVVEGGDSSQYVRSPSPESPLLLESGVTQAVRSNVNLLNLYDHIDSVDEHNVVQDIMSNLMVAPIEENAALIHAERKPKPKSKSGWLDDLITEKAKKSLKLPTATTSTVETKGKGVPSSKKAGRTKTAMVKMLEDEEDREAKVDYRKRIGDRHEQVRHNRQLRERQIAEERQKRRQVRETRRQAEEMVTREEKQTSMRRLAEEEEIKREMARIKKEMEEQKTREEERKRYQMEEEMMRMTEEEEERNRIVQENEKAKQEEAARERDRQLNMQKLDIRIRNAELRTMRVHFSNWRNVIIDQRLQLGQARAIADWRLLMKTWATWNGKYKTLWATQEGQRHLESMRENQRRQKGADDFYRKQLLKKCLRSWNIWVRAQMLEQELEKEKVETQKKMEAFLKACAIEDSVVGDGGEDGVETLTTPTSAAVDPKNKKPPQPKKLQPWQVTKKHVYEGINESPAKAETLKTDVAPKSKSAFIVDSFQHRHLAQEHMLKTQQEIIKEQQRMLEEMKFIATQNSLQQQLKDIQSKGENPTEVPAKSSRIDRAMKARDKESLPSNLSATKAKVAASLPAQKQIKFVQDMEERARLRAERKAELERLKEQKQKEKLQAQRQKEEEERKREEEEKRKRLDELREKKRIEKEQEIEKERKANEAKVKYDLAVENDQRRLLKWWGIEVWKKCLEDGRQKSERAEEFREKTMRKVHLNAWAMHVRDLYLERNRKSILCQRRQLQRRYFGAWRCLKENSLQLEVKARQYWSDTLKKKAFSVWTIWTHDEKMAGLDKEKRADDHHDEALVKKVFQLGFKLLPVIAKRERERESRKNLLRRKVADLLPDFSTA